MATPVAAPPVSNLHDDLLLHIFHFNAEMPDRFQRFQEGFSRGDPIVVARRTSQVCRSWRQIIVGSTALWGSMIDMKISTNSSDAWVEEVLGRTGTADLTIYGIVRGEIRQSRLLFAFLVLKHWHRVRNLDIIMHNVSEITLRTWTVVWSRPAPNLRTFLINTPSLGGPVKLTSVKQCRLFCDSAPLLNGFHCSLFGPFDLNTSWLSQLSVVSVSCPLWTTDVLNMVSHTPRLTELFIHNTFETPTIDWMEPIHLPELRRLEIKCSLQQATVYLQIIVRTAGCGLDLQTNSRLGVISVNQVADVLPLITPYAQSYIDTHRPSIFALTFVGLRFCDAMPSDLFRGLNDGPPIWEWSSFDQHTPKSDWPRLYPTILPYLTSSIPSLSKITHFRFHLQESLYECAWAISDDPKTFEFIFSMSSVTYLTVSERALYILERVLESASSSSALLPSLRHLHLEKFFEFKIDRHNVLKRSQTRLVLILSRLKARLAPFTLDLGVYGVQDYSRPFCNWEFLDQGGLDGLSVCWKILPDNEFSYVCGSGDPDALFIYQNFHR